MTTAPSRSSAIGRRCPSKSPDATRPGSGDWEVLALGVAAENEFALDRQFGLFSVYRDRHDTKFWIITEADRSSTTILLPEDY